MAQLCSDDQGCEVRNLLTSRYWRGHDVERASHRQLQALYDLCINLMLAAAKASRGELHATMSYPRQVRQQLTLLVQCIGFNEFIQPFAGQHGLYIVLCYAYAVIRDAALREIVRPDFLGPIATAGLCHPVRTRRRSCPLPLELVQLGSQHLHTPTAMCHCLLPFITLPSG